MSGWLGGLQTTTRVQGCKLVGQRFRALAHGSVLLLLAMLGLCNARPVNMHRPIKDPASTMLSGQSFCMPNISIVFPRPDVVYETFNTLHVFVDWQREGAFPFSTSVCREGAPLRTVQVCTALIPSGSVQECHATNSTFMGFLWGIPPGQFSLLVRRLDSNHILAKTYFTVQRSNLPLPASPTLYMHLLKRTFLSSARHSARHPLHAPLDQDHQLGHTGSLAAPHSISQRKSSGQDFTILPLTSSHALIAPATAVIYKPGALAVVAGAPSTRWAACQGDHHAAQPICIVSSDIAGMLPTTHAPGGVLDALGVPVDALVPPNVVAPACMLTWWAWRAPDSHAQHMTEWEAWVHAASCGDEVPLVYQLGPPQLSESVLNSESRVRKSDSIHVLCTRPHVLRGHAHLSSLLPAHSTRVIGETPTTLLTVFTTLVPRRNQTSPQAQQKNTIQSSVIRALAALRPHVALVVFTDDSGIAQEVQDLGAAAVTGGFRTAPYGAPYLRDMYAWVQQHSQSPLYGFMNADILFGPDLVDAVDVVLRGIANGTLGKRVLVTGRRFNVEMPLPFAEGHAWSVPKGASASDVSRIHHSMRNSANVFLPQAMDFFFITRGTWNWSAIPDFAPGRATYDTWLSDHSFRDLVPRVEISRCVWPQHLSGSDGHFSGSSTDLPYHDFNERQAKTRVGGTERGSMEHAEWRLQAGGGSGACQLVPGTGQVRVGDERGWPWTGKLREGHVDPITGKVL